METSNELDRFLSGIAIFGGLEKPTLDRLVARIRVEEYAPMSVVVREGDLGTSMYIVRSGEVALYQESPSHRPVRIARLGEGDCFGEMAIMDVQPRSASVVVEKTAVLYSLTNQDLYALYREDMPGYVMLVQNLCRELSRRLRKANARITDVASSASDETTQIRYYRPKRDEG